MSHAPRTLRFIGRASFRIWLALFLGTVAVVLWQAVMTREAIGVSPFGLAGYIVIIELVCSLPLLVVAALCDWLARNREAVERKAGGGG